MSIQSILHNENISVNENWSSHLFAIKLKIMLGNS